MKYQKEVYEKPELKIYGDLEKLTKDQAGLGGDGSGEAGSSAS